MKNPESKHRIKTLYDFASELDPNVPNPEDCEHMKVKAHPVNLYETSSGRLLGSSVDIACVFCKSPLSRIKPGTKGLLPQ